MSEQRNIILIGYRGCGKTTVGRVLAKQLSKTFIDSDEQVETEAGVSIKAIFDVGGEAEFRRLEKDAIADIVQQSSLVISVGGGAILDPQNAERLRASGQVVWLTAPADALWRRIKSDARSATGRPDLTEEGGLEEVCKVLARREQAYSSAAHFSVNTSGRTASEVATAILEILDDGVNAT